MSSSSSSSGCKKSSCGSSTSHSTVSCSKSSSVCSCGSMSSSCSSLSCLKDCNKGEMLVVRQFLDFNLHAPAFVTRVIPKPCCTFIPGMPHTKNRLGLTLQEMKPPFFIEVVRKPPCCKGRRDNSSHCIQSRTKCCSSRK